MSLRTRLAAAFALVALLTAGAVALATPAIVGHGFAILAAEDQGPGAGRGAGPMAGPHAQQVQQDTIVALVAVAVTAAAGATLLGALLATRITQPLRRLEHAAAAVARGELDRRSGLASRPDELGSLGRSFDAMAAELAGTETARRRFFQDVVHELRTPLAVIEATTSAVLDGVYGHEDRHVATIRDQARALSRTVDDLRTISLAESGALPLRLDRVEVGPLLERVALAFAPVATGPVSVDARRGLAVRADAERVRQAIAALVDNAVRHAPGSAVRLEAARLPASVRIAVSDGGPGIAPADLPRLFDRFYRGDPAHDRSGGSSGLGLAIVRAIATAHGGTVGAANVPGGGARFWIDLPDAAASTSDGARS